MTVLLNYSSWHKLGIVGPIVHFRAVDVPNDLVLIREILGAVRDKEYLKPRPIQIEGYEPVLVMRHVKRLYDDNLLEGTVSQAIGLEAPMVLVTDLTTAGHNFLAALEQETVWNRLSKVLSPTELASLTWEQIAELAKELAFTAIKKKLGL